MTRWADVRTNLFAGLVVALIGLPQCLAYAMMSGLPPAYGSRLAAVPGSSPRLRAGALKSSPGPRTLPDFLS
jgi:SulP family sulfate permease